MCLRKKCVWEVMCGICPALLTELHLNTTKARMASKATVLDTAAAWQGIVRTQWTIPMERAQTPII